MVSRAMPIPSPEGNERGKNEKRERELLRRPFLPFAGTGSPARRGRGGKRGQGRKGGGGGGGVGGWLGPEEDGEEREEWESGNVGLKIIQNILLMRFGSEGKKKKKKSRRRGGIKSLLVPCSLLI